MGKHPLKAKQFEAIQLRLQGLSNTAIAKQLGISLSTLRDWLAREDVRAVYDQELRGKIRDMYNKASRKIENQIEDDNPWIAQNAARTVLTTYGGLVLGEDKQEIVVHIAGGMPDIGMPERSEDD
jgi:transposase